jgi:hypothetical protein
MAVCTLLELHTFPLHSRHQTQSFVSVLTVEPGIGIVTLENRDTTMILNQTRDLVSHDT